MVIQAFDPRVADSIPGSNHDRDLPYSDRDEDGGHEECPVVAVAATALEGDRRMAPAVAVHGVCFVLEGADGEAVRHPTGGLGRAPERSYERSERNRVDEAKDGLLLRRRVRVDTQAGGTGVNASAHAEHESIQIDMRVERQDRLPTRRGMLVS